MLSFLFSFFAFSQKYLSKCSRTFYFSSLTVGLLDGGDFIRPEASTALRSTALWLMEGDIDSPVP